MHFVMFSRNHLVSNSADLRLAETDMMHDQSRAMISPVDA